MTIQKLQEEINTQVKAQNKAGAMKAIKNLQKFALEYYTPADARDIITQVGIQFAKQFIDPLDLTPAEQQRYQAIKTQNKLTF